ALLPAINDWRSASVSRDDWASYNDAAGDETSGQPDIFVKTIEHEKVRLEMADKTSRAITTILGQAPYQARDSLALVMEFLHSPVALKILQENVEDIATKKGVTSKVGAVLAAHTGHPADLVGTSFNPWALAHSRLKKLSARKAASELRKIAANSRRFQEAVNELEHKGGMVDKLLAAPAGELATVLAASPGWRSFRAKNFLRFRQPTSRCSDHGRYATTPEVVLAGSGPRRVLSQRLGTTAWVPGKQVAALESSTAGALQLWSALLRQCAGERAKALAAARKLATKRHKTPALERLLKWADKALLPDYGMQFAFCEESQLLSRLAGPAPPDEEAGDESDVAAGDDSDAEVAAGPAAGGA
ncbi:unnamed protein product, partial [Prorocentrum cordatum]